MGAFADCLLSHPGQEKKGLRAPSGKKKKVLRDLAAQERATNPLSCLEQSTKQDNDLLLLLSDGPWKPWKGVDGKNPFRIVNQ